MESKENLSDLPELYAEEQELKDTIKSAQTKLSILQEKIIELEIAKAIDGVENSYKQALITAIVRADKWFSTRVKKMENKVRINDDIFCAEADENFAGLRADLNKRGYVLVRGSAFSGDKDDDSVYWIY